MSDVFQMPGILAWHTKLLTAVESLVAEAANLDGNPSPEKKGGYLSTIHIPTGVTTIQSMVGEILLEKRNKYRDFSEEKPRRMLTWTDHISSFESRDPERGMWGGGVLAGKEWAIGFSGLPELIDEAVVTAAAYYMELIGMADVVAIAKRSDNPHIGKLINFVQGPMTGYVQTQVD